MNTFEKSPIYDEKGRVIDPDIARKAADAENEYHKKTLGIFSPSEKKIRRGETAAAFAIDEYTKMTLAELPRVVISKLESYEKEFESKGVFGLGKYRMIVDKIFCANIGGGTMRYRVFCEFNNFVLDVASKAPGLSDVNIQVVIDIKEGAIIKSASYDA